MYTFACALKTTGHLLWSFGKVDTKAVNELIADSIIPKNLRSGSTDIKSLTMDFLIESDVLFIISHPSVVSISYSQDLLKQLANVFNDMFPEFKYQMNCQAFNKVFEQCTREFALKELSVKPLKKQRKWDDKVTQQDIQGLDYSDDKISEQRIDSNLIDKAGMGSFNNGLYDAKPIEAPKSTGLASFLTKTLDSESLEPVMAQMKEHLIQKNVAAEIAESLCASVTKSLVGQKTFFGSQNSSIKKQMQQELSRILTPKTSTDLLREIMAKKAKRKPYSIVFVGVNGVGKSTNLSKVCFWLLQNKLKILVAACDTFRSGAVEQLGVHVRNLKSLTGQQVVVDLFQRGYGKDSASIAKDALAFAEENHYDVCLIDTAGRMQNNEPLMRALAKLVTTNDPDKIIFVGEALVGNEAVDQVSKFNAALKDYSSSRHPRQIDGLILTKFDTIDDKVGAALTMTFVTGQPILFVGTGQTYTDLRKLQVETIVDTLLS